jgi:hypothetical protein
MTAFGAVLGLSSQALFFEVITEKADLGEVAFEFRAVVVSGDLAITEPMQALQKVLGSSCKCCCVCTGRSDRGNTAAKTKSGKIIQNSPLPKIWQCFE